MSQGIGVPGGVAWITDLSNNKSYKFKMDQPGFEPGPRGL